MPAGTMYKSEISLDPNLARVIYNMNTAAEEQQRTQELFGDDEESAEDGKELHPTPSVGHTLEVELMMKQVDLLQVLISTLIGVNLPKGKRPPKVRPLPRPVSALAAMEHKRELQAVDSALEAMFSGGIEVPEGPADPIT